MATSRLRGITPEGPNATSGNNRATGRHTQKTVIVEELEEIQNTIEARRYLEKTSLIVPPGQTLSPSLLSTALHHVTEYKGLPKPAVNAIRSIAFLLEEMEDNSLHETIRDSVTVQLNELGSDLKDFITDTTQRIDKHVEDKLALLSEATKDLVDSVKAAISEAPPFENTATRNGPTTDYRKALLHPPPHIDPRLAAKEGIRLRQFLLEGITRESKITKMNAAEAKKTVNQALDDAGGNGLKARSALWQNKSGLLVEMDSDPGAAWLMDPEHAKAFCTALCPGLTVKQRPFNVLAYNAPTALDPNNSDHIQEICEVNDIRDGGLLAMRWVKPMNRRERADQRTAHLILTFSNAEEANRAILAGLVICHRRLRVAKTKKEPVRCMKCHTWNHVARECSAREDTCGTCGDNGHWTKDCTNKNKKHCVSCDTDEHASWSRYCPTFLRKCEELDMRTPENSLPFFPSAEPWTWASTPPPTQSHSMPAAPPPISTRGRNQQERTQLQMNTAPSGRPYERRSWNRPSPGSQPPTSDKPIRNASFFSSPPLETPVDEISPPANSQDSMYV